MLENKIHKKGETTKNNESNKINNEANIFRYKAFNSSNICLFQELNLNKNYNSDNRMTNINTIKYEKNLIKAGNNKAMLLLYFILINLINIALTENINNQQNSIILKINGNGYQQIISKDKLPDLVYLNDDIINIDEDGCINIQSEEEEESILKLIWNNKLDNCAFLFDSLTNITEIDLSDFDSSKVTTMKGMFSYCSNLEYINFDNFNTSLVTDMSYMFKGCISLPQIDFSNFETSKVTNMVSLFSECISLYSIDLSYFNTSQVQNMEFIFYKLENLEYLDLSHLDTSNLTNMDYMFISCESLTYLDLSNLNTSKVQSMKDTFTFCTELVSINMGNIDISSVTNLGSMFYGCSSLASLDLSKLNTSNVVDMNFMFAFCESLVSINLTGINTYNVYDMSGMFFYCSSLESLDLSSFNFIQVYLPSIFENCHSLTSIKFSRDYKSLDEAFNVFKDCISLLSIDLFNFDFGLIVDLSYFFYGCSSLTSVDLSSIDTFSVEKLDFMFYGCNSLKNINLENWITSSVKSIKSMFYDCTSLISLDLSNYDTSYVSDMKELFYNCVQVTSINLNNFVTSLVTNMESMFYGCNSLLSLNLSSFDTSKVTNMRSMFFSCSKLSFLDISNFNTKIVVNMASMFSGCEKLEYINFYNYDDSSLIFLNNIFFRTPDNLILCIKNSTKIESELSNLKCSIATCSEDWKEMKNRIIYNNRTCIDTCKNDEINKYEFEYCCYNECPKGTHSSKRDKYLCEINTDDCKSKSPFLYLKNNSCAENCSSEDFFNNECELNSFNTENKGLMVSNIIKEIEGGLMDKLIMNVIKDKKDIIIEKNDTIYQITSSFNKTDNFYKNLSFIKLGECENALKKNYGILENESLVILKIEQKLEGFLIPLIEYEIFSPKTNEKLNLYFCNNLEVDVFIPVSINKNMIYKYNPYNSYYNDFCNTTTTEYGTDLTLYDRRLEYNINKYFLCQENCKFINYSAENELVLCKCKVEDRIVFNKTKLLNNLKIIKSITNLKAMKCSKLLFSKEGLIKNIPSYIIIIIIFLHLISLIYFYSKEHKILVNRINELLNLKKRENVKKEELNGNFSDVILSTKKPIKSQYLRNDQSELNYKKNYINSIFQSQNSIFTDQYEINNISYINALENDKRTCFQFYISLLKNDYIITFTFIPKNDYNPYSIKICLFFFIFGLHLVLICLFFNDEIMHKIYENKGFFDYINFIPQLFYSSFICSFINIILKKIYLSQKIFLDIKYKINICNLNAKISYIIACLNIKIICFFILNFMFLLFFWYYLSCFSVVYKNTQIYVVKTMIFSFLLSLTHQFIIFFFVALFRIFGLKGPGKFLYKFSQIIQLI